MKLYELTEAYNKLFLLATDTEADIQCIEDTLQSLEAEIEDKAESIAKILKNMEADETAIKTEEERLYNKRKAIESRRVYLKKYLETELINLGKDKIKTNLFTLAIQNNAPSLKLVYDDARMYPDKYHKYKVELDKRMMLEDVKNGAEIMGAGIEQTKSLRVR